MLRVRMRGLLSSKWITSSMTRRSPTSFTSLPGHPARGVPSSSGGGQMSSTSAMPSKSREAGGSGVGSCGETTGGRLSLAPMLSWIPAHATRASSGRNETFDCMIWVRPTNGPRSQRVSCETRKSHPMCASIATRPSLPVCARPPLASIHGPATREAPSGRNRTPTVPRNAVPVPCRARVGSLGAAPAASTMAPAEPCTPRTLPTASSAVADAPPPAPNSCSCVPPMACAAPAVV